MIRIVIADDHGIMREGLKQMFALADDIEVVGEAQNAEELNVRLRQKGVDVVLLDMNMPGMSGVALITHVTACFGLPILVLSMHNEVTVAERALKAGAHGYVTKDSPPQMLFTAIRTVAKGGRYISHDIAEKIAAEKPSLVTTTLHEKLTAREFYIMLQLARGKSNKEIAQEIFISEKTVSTHKTNLMLKMRFTCNADLVRYAIENGLLD